MTVNFENLEKIRNWLSANDIPFDVRFYREGKNHIKREDLERIKNECDTHGCVLGWAIHIPGLEPHDCDFDKFGILNFNYYSKRVIGVWAGSNRKGERNLWNFLFSSLWACTSYAGKEDAIKRIDYVVDNRIESLRPGWGEFVFDKDLVAYWRNCLESQRFA